MLYSITKLVWSQGEENWMSSVYWWHHTPNSEWPLPAVSCKSQITWATEQTPEGPPQANSQGVKQYSPSIIFRICPSRKEQSPFKASKFHPTKAAQKDTMVDSTESLCKARFWLDFPLLLYCLHAIGFTGWECIAKLRRWPCSLPS